MWKRIDERCGFPTSRAIFEFEVASGWWSANQAEKRVGPFMFASMLPTWCEVQGYFEAGWQVLWKFEQRFPDFSTALCRFIDEFAQTRLRPREATAQDRKELSALDLL
jgi:hypothetical protein